MKFWNVELNIWTKIGKKQIYGTWIPPNLGNAPKNFGIGQLTQAFWTRKKADGSLDSPLCNYERSAKSRNL